MNTGVFKMHIGILDRICDYLLLKYCKILIIENNINEHVSTAVFCI